MGGGRRTPLSRIPTSASTESSERLPARSRTHGAHPPRQPAAHARAYAPDPDGVAQPRLLLLATPVQFWAGWRFYRALGALKHWQANMNTLVVMGTSAAYLYSAVATLAPGLFAAGRADVYFDTSALIITLILLGRLLEARAKGRTNEAIKKLAGLQAKTARVVRGGEEVDVPVESVEIGDVVVVRPGEKIPSTGASSRASRRWTSQ